MIRILCLLIATLVTAATAAADPHSSLQWGLSNSGNPQSIELDFMLSRKIPARTGESINLSSQEESVRRQPIIAVLDTGVDKKHPELMGKLLRKDSECQALEKYQQCLKVKKTSECDEIWFNLNNPEVDQDKNGYPMDCEGWSILPGVNNVSGIRGAPVFGDDQGHGTHVAGVIAAKSNNGSGISGASSSALILPVQVLGKAPNEPTKPLSINLDPRESVGGTPPRPSRYLGDLVARGMIYAIRSGADIINLSLGWPQGADSQLMRDVIAEAHSRGIIIVAAAGNDSTQALLRPCSYPGVICVASHGPDGAISHFSNYGIGVDLAAPGLNILSLWPMEKRPIRFRPERGYEFLHGTSQATPFVAAAAAELLARGISRDEIYPRLILGTRSHQQPLKQVKGSPHENPDYEFKEPAAEAYPKFTLSGNLDVANSLKVQPQALILPAKKERITVLWDRKSKKIHLPLELENFWTKTNKKIKIQARMAPALQAAIRPRLESVEQSQFESWQSHEIKQLTLNLAIQDQSAADLSRIPSELDVEIMVQIGSRSRRFVVGYDLVVKVDKSFSGEQVQRLALPELPKGNFRFIPVVQNSDNFPEFKDYFYVEFGATEWKVYLLKQNRKHSALNSDYQLTGPVILKVPEEKDKTVVKNPILTRIDLNFDGESEYVIGLLEDRSKEKPEKNKMPVSPMHFYFLNSNLELIKEYRYSSEVAQIPNRVWWMRVGNELRPAFMGPGKDPARKIDLWDYWQDEDLNEKLEIRLYYLDQNWSLKGIKTFGDDNVMDILAQSNEQLKQGRLPLLLAKNTGTEVKPSYYYEFKIAELEDGEIKTSRNVDFSQTPMGYRNLIDTRVDFAYNLKLGRDLFSGTFWFGPGQFKRQRLSVLSTDLSSLYDYELAALRGDVDAALWVRYAFLGQRGVQAFVITNSEIQFHQLSREQEVVRTSLNRYTFLDDYMTTDLQFPFMLGSATGKERVPALYTTEGSRFNVGIRFTLPQWDTQGHLVELVAPAALRFMAGEGCKVIDSPFTWPQEAGAVLDYFCGESLIRIPLIY